MAENKKTANLLNYNELHKHNQAFYRRVNDIYIDTIAVIKFLDSAVGPKKDTIWNENKSLNIRVPSHKGTASIKRNSDQLRDIMTIARDSGQWEKSLVFLISITEDLIASYIRLALRSKPLMLLTSIKSNEGKINVSLVDIIKNGLDQIIEEQVHFRVTNAIYASPKEYSSYLSTLIDCKFDENLMAAYIEVKARRDIILHSAGIVNQTYIKKSGELAGNVKVGTKISIDKEYYDNATSKVKTLAKYMHEHFLKKFGNDEDIRKTISEIGI